MYLYLTKDADHILYFNWPARTQILTKGKVKVMKRYYVTV